MTMYLPVLASLQSKRLQGAASWPYSVAVARGLQCRRHASPDTFGGHEQLVYPTFVLSVFSPPVYVVADPLPTGDYSHRLCWAAGTSSRPSCRGDVTYDEGRGDLRQGAARSSCSTPRP